MKPAFKEVTPLAIKNLSMTVVYDNNPYKEGLTTSWGFACVIKGAEKTILFDTGGNSAVLLNNMQQLGIDPKEIDVVVLSHIHGDHVGGLNGFLQENINVTVCLPATFPLEFKESLKRAGIQTVAVNDPARICKGVYSTGVLGNLIKEQALVISTDRGLIVITGCAHPGIVNILKTVKELNADKILLVMGGFHLGAMGKPQLEKIIVNFRKLGVQQVGPCHCTGDVARQMFKEAYGSDYMDVGVGRLIGFDITKRKRAEDALKESKSTIQALLDATLEAALLIDTKGTVLAVNEIGARRMGKSKDGIIGANAYDFFPPDVAKNRAEKVKIVLSSGKPLRFADEHSGRHYYHSLYPVFDSDGIVDKVAIFGQDLTLQHQNELALRDSEEKYRQLFENDSDAVMIIDAETGQFEDANQAALDLYGYSKDEFLTLKAEDISAEKEKTRSHVKKIRDGGAYPKRVPLRYFKKKDGTVFPGEISAGRFTIAGRKKIIGAVRDITERLRMQEALRESEEFSTGLLANSPNPILVIAPDTSVKYVNPAFENLTGYLSSEILGSKLPYPWWIKGLLSQTGKDFDKVFKTGILDLEQTFQKKNGERFWVEISSKPVRKDGELMYYLSSWVDTTERRQVQEKLRASEEKYRTLVDNIAIGVSLISPNMEILTINSQLQKWFPDIKVDKKPLCYQAFNDPPGEDVCTYCPTIQTLQDGQVHESLTETPAGDKIRNYRIISSPIKDAEGKVVAAIEMVEDVTDRLRIQKALQESERRFKSIFENAPIGFYRTTPDGRILDANPALIQMLGYSCFEELAAVNIETHAYHPQYPRHQFRERIERDGVIKGMELLWKKLDDTLVYMRENAIAVRDENGTVVCYEGTIEDITDQRQAEEHIHLLSRQLMQAQEDERQMISRELHDTVAQELSAAKMECDLIYGELLNDRPLEAQRIKGAVGILQKSILGVRNIAYDLRPPGLEKLGLVETVYRFCEDFTQMWGVPVDFQSAGLKNLKLDYINQINLYRLVQEGLTNIRKHAAASRVTVKLTAAFPNIVLRIEDNGRGFDVQKRAATAGQEKRMGLRSMQERVKLLNGQMKLQSKPGRGTKVSIKLPIVEKKHGTQENHLNR